MEGAHILLISFAQAISCRAKCLWKVLRVLLILILLVQREGKALPEASLPFHRAMPSMTHMALVELERAGILKFVISQVICVFAFFENSIEIL